MTLLTDLDTFFQEHRRGGDLGAAVESDRVWMTCTVRRGDQRLDRRRLSRLLVRVTALVHVASFG